MSQRIGNQTFQCDTPALAKRMGQDFWSLTGSGYSGCASDFVLLRKERCDADAQAGDEAMQGHKRWISLVILDFGQEAFSTPYLVGKRAKCDVLGESSVL
jgi:hypothetical protein